MWWLSENLYSAAGFGGNYILIYPELDLLIITRWLEPSQQPQFIKMVIESLSL
jgi:hypothetical protein